MTWERWGSLGDQKSAIEYEGSTVTTAPWQTCTRTYPNGCSEATPTSPPLKEGQNGRGEREGSYREGTARPAARNHHVHACMLSPVTAES